MNQIIDGVYEMLKKRQQRKTAYVDMDGFKVYYEGIGSKNDK